MSAVVKEMSVDALRELLAPAERLERTFLEPSSGAFQLAVERGATGAEQLRVQAGSRTFRISSEAYGKLGRLVGIPVGYLSRTPVELMVPHVNHWLTSGKLAVLGYAVEDTTVRLVGKGLDTPISCLQVLDALEAVAGRELSAHHVVHNLYDTCFSITTSEERAVQPGDPVRSGITVETSYAGLVPLQISAYVHRLVCTNGAISSEHVYRHSHRLGEGTTEWLRDVLALAVGAADREVERLRQMREVRLTGHLAESLESIFAEYSVPTRYREGLTEQVLNAPPETLYDLYNLITQVGSNDVDVLAQPQMARRLMRAGGRMAQHHELCNQCHRVMV